MKLKQAHGAKFHVAFVIEFSIFCSFSFSILLEVYEEPCQASRMKYFAKTLNGRVMNTLLL